MAYKGMSLRAKRKRQQKIVFWFLTIALSVGLIGSSVMWSAGDGGTKTSDNKNQQQSYNPEQELNELEKSAKSSPQDVDVLGKLALAYEQNNMPEQALKTYEKIVAIDPKNIEAATFLMKKYYYAGGYDEAEKYAKQLLALEPDNQDVHYFYGFILADGKKNYRAGIAQLEECVRLAKTGPDVQVYKETIKDWQSKLEQKQQ
jgi:cytochrome c-type biogenesis protein CcmH/NrfG